MDNFPKGAFIAPFGFAGKGRVVGEVSDPSKGRAALLSGGESVKGAEPPCPPTGRPATNEVCLATFGSFGRSKELDFLLHFCIKTKVE